LQFDCRQHRFGFAEEVMGEVLDRADRSRGPGWWLGQDGSWYPPEQYDYWVSLQPRHMVEAPATLTEWLGGGTDPNA
jgi:hypothetical protein